jgi:hypothetical protein
MDTTVALNARQSGKATFPAVAGNVPGGVCSNATFANGDQMLVAYRPYESAGGVWSAVLRTFPLDSDLPSARAGGSVWSVEEDVVSLVVNGGDVCDGNPFETGVHYDLATTDEMYGISRSLSGVVVAPVCRRDSRCPLATTCVLAERRFEDELVLLRGDLPRSAFLSEVPIERRHVVLDAMVPKVLLSSDRADAFFGASPYGSTTNLFLPPVYRAGVVGATRVRVVPEESSLGERTIISLSPVGSVFDGLSRNYGDRLSNFWEPWLTDVIRIERFGVNSEPYTTGPLTFSLYVPELKGDTLVVYMFPPTLTGGSPTAIDVVTVGGVVRKSEKADTWLVTVPSVNADFIATEDVDECTAGTHTCYDGMEPFTQAALCTNKVEGFICTCPEGFVEAPVGTDDTARTGCVLASRAFTPPDYYLRIANLDRLDYGWRVKGIDLYASESCTGAKLQYNSISVDGTVYTGGSYDNKPPSNLVDGSPKTQWWSECLNCDPEQKEIVLTIKGTTNVGCVKLSQQEPLVDKRGQSMTVHTTGIIVQRGPVSGPGCSLPTDPGYVELCTPTLSHTVTGKGPNIDASLACGAPDTFPRRTARHRTIRCGHDFRGPFGLAPRPDGSVSLSLP